MQLMALPRLGLALAIAASCVAQASSAGAVDREACFSSAESAQQLRKAGHLRQARERLLVCEQQGCPASVQSDCVTWLAQVGSDLPSIVVQVHDATGNDLTDVNVLIDGVSAATRLEGKPIDIDPGPHELRLERAGMPTVQRSIVAVVGQKARIVEVQLEPSGAPHEEAPSGNRPIPLVAMVLGGVGAAALVATGVFWAWGRVDYGNLQGSCSPTCNPSDVSGVRTKLVVGDVALGVGVVSLGVAAWLFFTRKEEAAPAAVTPDAQLLVHAAPGGGLLGLGGHF
jgi:hypothetical protein